MKPKSKVFTFFNEVKVNNKVVYVCKYCSLKYTHVNATKMKVHVKKCTKCPEEKKKCLDLRNKDAMKNSKDAVFEMDVASGLSTSSCSSTSRSMAFTMKNFLDKMEATEKVSRLCPCGHFLIVSILFCDRLR